MIRSKILRTSRNDKTAPGLFWISLALTLIFALSACRFSPSANNSGEGLNSQAPGDPNVPTALSISPTMEISPSNTPEVIASLSPTETISLDPEATLTPEDPTITATPDPTLTATSIPAPEEWAELISTSPDPRTYHAPLTSFTQTWILKNIGSTAWTKDYSLVFMDGIRMSAKKVIPLPQKVEPGKSLTLTVKMTTPKDPGTFEGEWMLTNKAGEAFGLGSLADQPLINQVTVLNVDPNNSSDLLLKYCQATWRNNLGATVPCPSVGSDSKGFVYLVPQPYLENGRQEKPVLWVHPPAQLEASLTGFYPAYKVSDGDHFKSKVGCMGGYQSCNLTFKVLYRQVGGNSQTLGSWKQLYGGGISTINIDLSHLAGQEIELILRVTVSNNTPTSAHGFWMTPRIINLGPSIKTSTPEPTATFTPEPISGDTETPSPTPES